jgi:hypothetical protein
MKTEDPGMSNPSTCQHGELPRQQHDGLAFNSTEQTSRNIDLRKYAQKFSNHRARHFMPNTEQIMAVIDLVNDGKTIAYIASKTGLPVALVQEVIDKEGLRKPIDIRRERREKERSMQAAQKGAQNADRDERIKALALDGQTLSEIGRQVGISGERVRRILIEKWGLEIKDIRNQSRAVYEASQAHFESESIKWVREHPGCTLSEIGSALDVNEDYVRLSLPTEVRHLVFDLIKSRKNAQEKLQHWSDEQVFAAIRVAANQSTPLSRAKYDELRISMNLNGPSGVRILQRFDSWTRACQLSGVVSGATPDIEYQRKWTPEELILWLGRFLLEAKSGSAELYDEWSRSTPGAPSGLTIRNTWGTWSECKNAALEDLRVNW